MGVTIYTKNDEDGIWIGGYGSFFRLRSLIAEVYDKQKHLNGEFADFYKNQYKGLGWDNYSKKLSEFKKEHNLSKKVLDFLYQPDNDGKLTPDGCRMIWKIMSDTKTCCEVFVTKDWYDHRFPEFGGGEDPCNWKHICDFFEKAWLDKQTIYWG